MQVNDSDLFILRHVWNTPEQEEILQEIVGPVLDQWYEQHPDQARIGRHAHQPPRSARGAASIIREAR